MKIKNVKNKIDNFLINCKYVLQKQAFENKELGHKKYLLKINEKHCF